MNDRVGQTWKLTNLDGSGYVIFTVLRSMEHYTWKEAQHEILILDASGFSIFEAGEITSYWWESSKMSWESDKVYARIA
jgi:hypothetical protein